MLANDNVETKPPQSPPAWTPSFPPLYAIDKTYMENADHGPTFRGPFPQRNLPAKGTWIDFFGFKLASPIGVAAGPLLNSRWIALAARLGYDLVCYKTIRSHAYPSHPLPNVIYVDTKQPLSPGKLPEYVRQAFSLPGNLEQIAITNSFGMPSRSPEYLRYDIPLANASLTEGQLMVVSVVGTPSKDGNSRDFLEDFIQTAKLAKESGAKIIEANFSCPNVSTGEGCIYYNPEAVYEITHGIVQALGDTPLILKVGLFPSDDIMRKSLIQAARAGARGISGINSVSMKVQTRDGRPALGADRLTSGICGGPILEIALDFVRRARAIINKERLSLELVGGGGIALPEHFTQFLNAGATIAMTATGMMWDPYLAARYREGG